MEESLDSIGCRHGTDNSSHHHGYLDVLEPYFAPLRHEPVNFLEIGVAGGASIRVWRDYFKHGRIVGIDHNPESIASTVSTLGKELDCGRIRLVHGDVTDRATWDKLEGLEFDICFDDGGHYTTMIESAMAFGWDRLKPGGLWVVCDLHFVYSQEINQQRKRAVTFIDYLKSQIDVINEFGHDQCARPRSDAPVKSLHIWKSLAIFEKSEATPKAKK